MTPARIRTRRSPTVGWRAARSNARCTPRVSTCVPGAVDAPPAKLPVRTHEVVIVDGVINVVLDDALPNLPPGVTTRAAGEAAQ